MNRIVAVIAVVAALAGASGAAPEALAGAGAPPERIRLVLRHAGGDVYTGAPATTLDGKLQAWTWLFAQRSPGDGVDAFAYQDEFDCTAGTYRRLRQENYAWPKLVNAYPSDTAAHRPLPFESETQILGVICDQTVLSGGEWVDSVDAAHAIAARRLGVGP